MKTKSAGKTKTHGTRVQDSRRASSVKVRTTVKAGGMSVQHNRRGVG
jgi:hypothetical protein